MPSLSSPKAERFAQELARGVDYKEAYVNAGYKESRTNAHALANSEHVQARVNELYTLEANAQGITLETVIAEIGAIAFANARDFFKWDQETGVTVLNSDALSEQQLKAIVGVKETKVRGERTIEVKLGDKLGALEKLLKHLKPPADSGDNHLHLHVESPLEQITSRIAGLVARSGTHIGAPIIDARPVGGAELGLAVLGPPEAAPAKRAGLGEPDGALAGRLQAKLADMADPGGARLREDPNGG